MHKHLFYVQTPKTPGRIYDGLLRSALSESYDQLTICVAYATKGACQRLVDDLASNLAAWNELRKRWLVSIDRGITDPNALSYLAELPNSIVKVPNADLILKNGLKTSYYFHPKCYIFDCQDDQDKIALFSGSCNLTMGGLYFNTEQATSLILAPPISKQERHFLINVRRQKNALEKAFESSSPLTDDILTKYRSLWRPTYLSTSKIEGKRSRIAIDRNPEIKLPMAIALATAEAFWVRVTDRVVKNLGPDRPGNQIDLQRGSRVFFGFSVGKVRPNTIFGSIRIKFEGQTSDYSVRFGHNYMDKINLPVLESPRTYAARTLLFKRDGDDVFNLYIGDSLQENRWRKKSEKQNTIYRMQSGREYGVFS